MYEQRSAVRTKPSEHTDAGGDRMLQSLEKRGSDAAAADVTAAATAPLLTLAIDERKRKRDE